MTRRAFHILPLAALAAVTFATPASADIQIVNHHGDPWPKVQRMVDRWDVPLPEGRVKVTRGGGCTGRVPGSDRLIRVNPRNQYGFTGCVVSSRPRTIQWWNHSRVTLAHELGHVLDLTRGGEHRRWHWRFRRAYMEAVSSRHHKISWWFGTGPNYSYEAGAEHFATGYAYCATGVNAAGLPSEWLDRGCDVLRRPVKFWRHG